MLLACVVSFFFAGVVMRREGIKAREGEGEGGSLDGPIASTRYPVVPLFLSLPLSLSPSLPLPLSPTHTPSASPQPQLDQRRHMASPRLASPRLASQRITWQRSCACAQAPARRQRQTAMLGLGAQSIGSIHPPTGSIYPIAPGPQNPHSIRTTSSKEKQQR